MFGSASFKLLADVFFEALFNSPLSGNLYIVHYTIVISYYYGS